MHAAHTEMDEPRSRVSCRRINVPELRSRLDGIEGPKLHAEHLRLRVGLRRHVSADNLVLVVLRETKGENEIASVIIIIIQSHTSRRSRVSPRLHRIVRSQLFRFIQSVHRLFPSRPVRSPPFDLSSAGDPKENPRLNETTRSIAS